MRFWVTVATMLTLIGLAQRFGRGPERSVAGLLASNFILAILNSLLRGPFRFDTVDPVLVTIDFGTLLGLTWIALKANRIWPLVASALQMLVMIAHASVLISYGWTGVYWGMMAVSQYLQLVALAVGITANYQREQKRGRYRDWRLAQHYS